MYCVIANPWPLGKADDVDPVGLASVEAGDYRMPLVERRIKMATGRASIVLINRPIASLGLSAVALVASCAMFGCGPRNKITLDQAAAPLSQQHMTLAGNWGFSDQKGVRRQCLLAFPLPGSRSPYSPRDFLVYVDLPGDNGQHTVAPSTADGAKGFLIQKKGDLAGISYFARGTVRVKRVWFRSGLKKIVLDVVCEDGTVVRGSARVRNDPKELDAFVRRYDADVAKLLRSKTPADETAANEATEATAPRAAAGNPGG